MPHTFTSCCRTALFDGAAVSAFFAVILVIIFTVTHLSIAAVFKPAARCVKACISVVLISAQQACMCESPAGLRHLLHDPHTEGLVTPRFTLWQGFHGRSELHDRPAHMQHSYTCKYKPAATWATDWLRDFLKSKSNVCLQFLSFSPAIKYWVTTFNVDFSRLLLTAT